MSPLFEEELSHILKSATGVQQERNRVLHLR